MIVGYARVSTDGQSTDAQHAALVAAGAEVVFAENISGSSYNGRAALQKALNNLRDGDVFIVTRLDRLARNTRDLLNVLDNISKKGATFKSLNDTWADTTSAHGRLMISVLGGLAEFERELIRARTSEGRTRAMANGVQFGRPPKMTNHQRKAAKELYAAGKPQIEIARLFNVSPATICVMLRSN